MNSRTSTYLEAIKSLYLPPLLSLPIHTYLHVYWERDSLSLSPKKEERRPSNFRKRTVRKFFDLGVEIRWTAEIGSWCSWFGPLGSRHVECGPAHARGVVEGKGCSTALRESVYYTLLKLHHLSLHLKRLSAFTWKVHDKAPSSCEGRRKIFIFIFFIEK